MTQPKRAEDALRRAVDAQRTQREVAKTGTSDLVAPREDGIEAPDSDRDK